MAIGRVSFYGDWQTDTRNLATDRKTGRVYGHTTHDTKAELRLKLFQVAFYQIIGNLIRIPTKIGSLLRAEFVFEAQAQKRTAEKMARQRYALGLTENPEPTPSTVNFSLRNLTKTIVQIVALPFAIVANFFICLYGVIDPYNSRALYAAIDDELASKKDHISICLQPRDVWERENLYSEFGQDASTDYRKLNQDIRVTLAHNSEFYNNESLDIKTLHTELIKADTSNADTAENLRHLISIKEMLSSIKEARLRMGKQQKDKVDNLITGYKNIIIRTAHELTNK